MHKAGETASVDDLALVFSVEVGCNLLEDAGKVVLRGSELTELPGGGRAPVEASLREVLMAVAVHSNGDVVVVFNA